MSTQQLTPYMFNNTEVRIHVGEDGEPWFIAADVANILGYASAKDFTRGLDDEDKGRHIVPTPSGSQEMTTLSEVGLYTALVRSRAERVKPFRRWVTHEVLPSIRKRGGYLTPEATEKALTDPDFIIQLATSLKEERAKRVSLEAQVEADAPHTRFGRVISASDGELLVKQVADLITQGGVPINQATLFKWLRANGWLCRNQGRLWNAPTKWALEHGYIRSSVLVISTGHGDREKVTPRITAAGQEVLIDGFLTGRYAVSEDAA